MERGGANAAMDRISELPQFIIHQILSYLSTKEAAQTSVLSKTWLQASSTSPILIIRGCDFSESPEIRHAFFSFVNNTLLRYRTHNLRIHKFEFLLHFVPLSVDHAPAYRTLVDQSIGTALDHGVKELNISIFIIDIKLSPYIYTYTLPQTIFSTSAEALTDLTVCYCKFPQNFASNAYNFPSLKTLNLYSAHIDDGMLQKLLSSCLSVEKITFHNVLGFKKFLVSNLCQLKVLDIRSSHDEVNDELIVFDIEDAPSLQFLNFHVNFTALRPPYLEVGSAQNLKHLVLESLTITNNFLNELITKCPLLEVLNISYCHGLERINFSGRSLKHLLLEGCKNLVEAEIDAPNLLTLEYRGHWVLSLSLVNTREELMTYIRVATHDFGWPDISWFHRMRELLKSVSRANISFNILLKGVSFHTDLDSIANPLPLENFMQEINQSSSLFSAFVDTLFSSSRPTTISTQWRLSPDYVDFIKFLGNELIMTTRNSNCCSSDQKTKCWRHYLKDIKVEVYENLQNGWQPIPLKTLLDQSRFLNEEIRFFLTWNANLNAPY